ncbi:hypothetical protein [Erwinia pyrifoliae]
MKEHITEMAFNGAGVVGFFQ